MATAQLTSVGVGIRNVLIATDFSRYSRNALECGLRLAGIYGATTYIVTAVPSEAFLLAGPDAYVAATEAAARDLEALKAELMAAQPCGQFSDYHLCVLEGEVSQAILNFARQKQIDLIVVGTHGRTGLGRAFMGSVAERIFRGSPVPVLSVGPHIRASALQDAPRNIVAAVDFTSVSALAARYAVRLARKNRGNLTLLHVITEKDLDHSGDRAGIDQKIERRVKSLLGPDGESVDCSIMVETGPVVPTILSMLERTRSDLLVIGVRRSSGVLDRLVLHHAYELLCECSRPVLTLREDARINNLN